MGIPDEFPGTDEFRELKQKSLAGMRALFVRQILIKFLFFAGNIVLARILAPQIFGIYAIVSFIVQFFSTFGDVGIGAALIQKKGDLTEEELSSTFWLQQLLVIVVVAVITVAAPLSLKVYPSLPPDAVWLVRAMAVTFLLASLKTVPAILMERNIDFNRIAWIDIAENLVFQVVALTCAFLGLETWSFIFAAIGRALSGAVIIYALSPWRPRFICRLHAVRDLVRFGLPYQGNQVLLFIKDAVTPLFVGAYAGAAAVGYVNWARNFAFAPLIVSESFGRVAFPAFARLQDDKELLSRTIERSIRMMTLVMFPITAVMLALGPEITHVVFTDKWRPGLAAFYLFCTSPLMIGIMLPLYSAIMSLGKSRILLKMTLVLLILEWGIGIPCVMRFGFVGITFSQPIVTVLFLLIYLRVLRSESIKVRLFRNITSQLIAASVAAILCRFFMGILIPGMATISLAASAGLMTFILLMLLLNRSAVQDFLQYLTQLKGEKKESP